MKEQKGMSNENNPCRKKHAFKTQNLEIKWLIREIDSNSEKVKRSFR